MDQNSDPLVLGRDLDTSGHLKVDIDSGIWTPVDINQVLNVDMMIYLKPPVNL